MPITTDQLTGCVCIYIHICSAHHMCSGAAGVAALAAVPGREEQGGLPARRQLCGGQRHGAQPAAVQEARPQRQRHHALLPRRADRLVQEGPRHARLHGTRYVHMHTPTITTYIIYIYTYCQNFCLIFWSGPSPTVVCLLLIFSIKNSLLPRNQYGHACIADLTSP